MHKIFIIFILIFLSKNLYSLDIKETIKNTVKNNIDVKLGLEEINEAKELIINSSGNFKPDIYIDLSEKKSITEKSDSTSTSTTNKLEDSYSLTINQNLYSGGKNKLELERSRILFNNEVESFYITINDLILKAIEGYLTVQVYEKTLDVTKKNFEVIEKIYSDTKIAKDVGTATTVDLKNALSSYELSKSNLIESEGNLKIGNKTFERIVGLTPINLEDIINIDKTIKTQDIIKSSINNNHDLKILFNDLESAKLQLEIFKREKFPTLDLTGIASYSDDVSADGTESTSASLTAKLSIPIFQQGIDDSDIRKYQSQLIQIEYKIENKKEDIKLDALMLTNNYNVFRSKVKSTSLQLDANKIALELLEREYEAGVKTFTDLINQEENLLNSYLNHFNSNKDLIMSYFQILSLEGKLVKTFEEYLPEL